MTDLWDILQQEGTRQIESPAQATGYVYRLTGGKGRFCLAWREGGSTRISFVTKPSTSEIQKITKALHQIPEGIVLWLGLYPKKILFVDVLSVEEALGQEESPYYTDRIGRASELIGVLGEGWYSSELSSTPETLLEDAKQSRRKIIGIKDVPYSDRAWFEVFDAGVAK